MCLFQPSLHLLGYTRSTVFCFAPPQFRSDIEKLDRVQWKATEIIRRSENLTYEDKGTFSLEKRELRVCNHCLKCLKDSYRENWDTPSTRMNCGSSEGNGWKMLKGRFWLGIKKIRVRMLEQTTQNVVASLLPEISKSWLARSLDNLLSTEGWNIHLSEVLPSLDFFITQRS